MSLRTAILIALFNLHLFPTSQLRAEPQNRRGSTCEIGGGTYDYFSHEKLPRFFNTEEFVCHGLTGGRIYPETNPSEFGFLQSSRFNHLVEKYQYSGPIRTGGNGKGPIALLVCHGAQDRKPWWGLGLVTQASLGERLARATERPVIAGNGPMSRYFDVAPDRSIPRNERPPAHFIFFPDGRKKELSWDRIAAMKYFPTHNPITKQYGYYTPHEGEFDPWVGMRPPGVVTKPESSRRASPGGIIDYDRLLCNDGKAECKRTPNYGGAVLPFVQPIGDLSAKAAEELGFDESAHYIGTGTAIAAITIEAYVASGAAAAGIGFLEWAGMIAAGVGGIWVLPALPALGLVTFLGGAVASDWSGVRNIPDFNTGYVGPGYYRTSPGQYRYHYSSNKVRCY